MPKKLPKQQDDDLMDFLKDDDDIEAATRVSFEIDPTTGKLSNESEPGLEKEYLEKLNDSQKDVEIDFGDDEEETPEVTIEKTGDEDEEQEKTSEPNSKTEVDEAAKRREDLERKRKSRSQERIRQLAKEKREAILRAAKAEKTLNDTNALYAKIQIDNLEKALGTIKKELQDAVENQDAEAIANANSKYVETFQQLKEFQKFLPDAEKASKESQTKIENFDKDYIEDTSEDSSDMEYPEAAQLWMEGKEFIWNNSEYKKLSVDQRKKIFPIKAEIQRVLETLVKSEGYSPDDPELYEELDLRVSTKFPYYEGIASKGIAALNSEEKTNKNSSGETSNTKKPRNVEEKTRSVPVKGSSSVGSQESSNGSKSVKVKISREDYRYWENYLQPRGITLQEYAKEIKTFENSQ